VADATAGMVFAARRNGLVEFQLGGIGTPRELAIDAATGDAWVTLVNPARVARISAAGKLLTLAAGFDQPLGLSLGAGP
jgi:hypothetical protein